MDTLLLPGQNPRAWAETMINLEARKLVNTANTMAAMCNGSQSKSLRLAISAIFGSH